MQFTECSEKKSHLTALRSGDWAPQISMRLVQTCCRWQGVSKVEGSKWVGVQGVVGKDKGKGPNYNYRVLPVGNYPQRPC